MNSGHGVTIDDTFHVELVHSTWGGSVAPTRRPALAKHGCKVEFPTARKSALAKIKIEALRLAGNGTRSGFLFSQRLFRAFPELGRE